MYVRKLNNNSKRTKKVENLLVFIETILCIKQKKSQKG